MQKHNILNTKKEAGFDVAITSLLGLIISKLIKKSKFAIKGNTEDTRKKYINRAVELFNTTNFSIGHIAETTGFNDYFLFEKKFKKVMGCSPSKYRKK